MSGLPSAGGNWDNIGGNYVAGNTAGRDYIEGDQTKINNTGEGVININKNNLNNIDSQFKNSIVEFENLLNDNLKSIKLSDEEIKSLQEDIEKLSGQVKDVKPDELIKDERKVKEIEGTQISLAEKIVKYLSLGHYSQQIKLVL